MKKGTQITFIETSGRNIWTELLSLHARFDASSFHTHVLSVEVANSEKASFFSSKLEKRVSTVVFGKLSVFQPNLFDVYMSGRLTFMESFLKAER